MNNLDKFAIWLQREQQDAEAFGDEAKTAPEREYWRGYYEAMTNANATYYGPTPLDSLASVESEYTRGIKDTLDDLQDAYPEIRNSDLWADFMESERN